MATEATFTVAPEAFPLGTIFERFPGVEIELERIVPGSNVIIPYVWVRGVEVDDIEGAFADHPGVKQIRAVDSVEDEHLLRVEWDPSYVGILSTLAETKALVTAAVGTNKQWTFDIRGDDHRAIADFQQRCLDRDIPIRMTALHALTPVETASEAAITDAQQEALVLAYERGYFNSPRDVTLEDLGAELGISQQAVSSRIRRGVRRILGTTLSTLEA